MFRDIEKTDFCYYPFMQILLASDGKYRPCSKHQDYITHKGEILTAENATLEDAWNSDYMQEIRQSFLDNKQFKGCSECWRMQKMGLRSMRYDSYQYNTPDEQVLNPKVPTRIELNASNVCNLRCRICYPNASNKWIKEYKDLYGKQEKVFYNLHEDNLNDIKKWAPYLEELCFFGGEPLLSKENFLIIDYLIEKGLAKNIDLLFNTNGTIFNDDIAVKLKAFKHVRMYFSIDDIEQRFEYQRKGASWENVRNNISKAYAFSRSAEGSHVDFKICTTLSLFNIYYLPEFFDFFEKNYPELKIFWNLLFDPWRLSMQILPQEVKDIIAKRLRDGIQTSYQRTEEETRTTEELIVFLNEKIDKPFDEFFRYVNRHDIYRKENFRVTFPEFYKVIEEYQPDYLNWGKTDIIDIHNQVEEIISGFLSKHGNSENIDSIAYAPYGQKIHQLLSSNLPNYNQEEKFVQFNRYKRFFRDTPYTELFFRFLIFNGKEGLHLEAFEIYKAYLISKAKSNQVVGEALRNVTDNLTELKKGFERDSNSLLFADLLLTEDNQLISDLSSLPSEEIKNILSSKYAIAI